MRSCSACRGSFFVFSIDKGGRKREGKTFIKLYSMLRLEAQRVA